MNSFHRATEMLFWLSLGLIAFTYFLYPAFLFVAYSLVQLRSDWRYLTDRRNRRVPALQDDAVPGISFLIPAYNEETHLLQKINNLRQMDYPRQKVQILFVSDGSTDATNEILKALPDPNIEMILLPHRSGKATALNQAVLRARHEILVFSDASTLFAADALRKLARHFADASVGAVCGALRFQASSESQQTEGIYWKYESMIRLMEARLGATLTASGAVYALRRETYLPLDPRTVLDDFVIPMNARRGGYRVLYDPEAIATDFAPESIKGEFTRRVRLATGSFASLMFLLRVPMGGFGRFAFVSHKLLRWILPLLLCTLLISNISLARQSAYAVFGLLQLSFYLWAGLGYLLRERMQGVRFVLLPYFLLAMNFAFLVGLFRYLTKQEEFIWQRVS
jgi:cellulose synthase/poly-beta-1,6-N-acetylglucosamine synthase-like glycosyltransferase